MIALLMSIDPILDMFRTAVNVFGDSLCCLFLNDTDDQLEVEPVPAQRPLPPMPAMTSN